MTKAEHGRAAAVLAVGFAMLVLGFPGLDMLSPDKWKPGSKQREVQLQQPYGRFAVAAADLNRTVRAPLVRVLTPLQRPLRLAQSWSLYGSGPRDVRHFEIRVDGELVYRSADSDHRWLRSELRYRKIRPIVDAYCYGNSKNAKGLASWIVKRAHQDFPYASDVAIGCTVLPWSLEGEEKPKFVRVHPLPQRDGP